MNNTLLLFFVCLLVALQSNAQTRKKAELEFIKRLNTIANNSVAPSPREFEGKYSIDSAYAISKTGLLSTTFRYTTDTSFFRMRLTVPISKIRDIFYDYYLVMVCDPNAVTIYRSATNRKAVKESGNDYLFHIGVPVSAGEVQQEKLQQALVALQHYYGK